MEAKAILKYARISNRKVGIVLDLIRNKPVDEARAILRHTPKAHPFIKTAFSNEPYRKKCISNLNLEF